MAAAFVLSDARCPVCGTSILSFGKGGRVESEDLHPVPIYKSRHAGEGYMICDECAVLAGMPRDMTLN